MPGLQAMGVELPLGQKWPGVQTLQLEAPLSSWNLPLGQWAHADEFGAAAKSPGEQFLGEMVPREHSVPAGQPRHWSGWVVMMSDVLWCVPGRQGMWSDVGQRSKN